ncbi:hypothetical protein [Propionispora hippei]|uniref:Uncharacterized protein n=1 Tax=Propionispora hippei DSM 15287 TaxID=1123003 RepID=A0A1M6GPT6_9FIRM|nr:hypothetical protein [Propionispora hippei]SHJ11961.1 hypothetical protein SAMN02745170_01778 [Propionispora hippei DSM 15287]
MNGRVERIMQEYRQMVMERVCLENQIRNFQGITEEEMIDSLQFSQPDAERVQTSGVSDKTGRIAVSYKDKMDRINKEWQVHLEKKHTVLIEELIFFESAVFSLSGTLPEFISDMVIKGLTWDDLSAKYHISRTMVAKNRKRAIRELETLYAIHDKEMAEYILS